MDGSRITKDRAKALRRSMGLPEVLLWKALKGGAVDRLHFRKQHPHRALHPRLLLRRGEAGRRGRWRYSRNGRSPGAWRPAGRLAGGAGDRDPQAAGLAGPSRRGCGGAHHRGPSATRRL